MNKKSKSVIVIDTPDACIECPLCYKSDKINLGNFTYKQLYSCKRVPEDVEYIYLPNILYQKPTWCPLPLLPEPKYLMKCFEKPELVLSNHVDCAYSYGYNDCLQDIQKGKH